MTINNIPNDGMYPELIALVRIVAHSKKIPKDDLVSLCYSPLDRSEQEKSNKEIHKRLRGTLLRWTSLGLFVEEEGQVQLHEDLLIDKKQTIDTLNERLPAFCRKLVLQKKHCAPVWNGDGISTDFVRGISWLLAQDIYQFPKGFPGVEALQLEQVSEEKKLSSNSVPWGGLKYWAIYFGFVSVEGDWFRIDPTAAIRDDLTSIFGTKKELAARDFIEQLSLRLPVLDFGSYRNEVEENLNPVYWRKPATQHLSMSLSFALRRLHLNNEIVLKGAADAGSSYWLTGRNYRTWEGFESVGLLVRGAR